MCVILCFLLFRLCAFPLSHCVRMTIHITKKHEKEKTEKKHTENVKNIETKKSICHVDCMQIKNSWFNFFGVSSHTRFHSLIRSAQFLSNIDFDSKLEEKIKYRERFDARKQKWSFDLTLHLHFDKDNRMNNSFISNTSLSTTSSDLVSYLNCRTEPLAIAIGQANKQKATIVNSYQNQRISKHHIQSSERQTHPLHINM